MTSIEWTNETWNPVRGCSIVSAGCTNCYAMKYAHRFSSPGFPYEGLTKQSPGGPVWTGAVRTVPGVLRKPLAWKTPRRIFVNSMSDLFHEGIPDEFISHVFAIMQEASLHTFQVLTKRPDRALVYLAGRSPLPNVWIGVSVENQATADERIPLLLRTPVAVRFVSYEPALGLVDFTKIPRVAPEHPHPHFYDMADLDWIIVGGESGPKARPFDVAWALSTIKQCKAAGISCFVKQLGANIRDRNDAGFAAEEETWAEGADAGKPTNPRAWPSPYGEVEHDVNGFREEYQGAPVRVHLRNRAGADPAEWPEDLRVREYPA